MLPDASMTLCGLAVDSELPDGMELRESAVVQGDLVTEDLRQGLRALLEKRDYARHISNLGLLKAETDHGKA